MYIYIFQWDFSIKTTTYLFLPINCLSLAIYLCIHLPMFSTLDCKHHEIRDQVCFIHQNNSTFQPVLILIKS